MSLISRLKFDPVAPLIARTGARALVGSINFSISNLIQQHLRAERFGLPASGIDQHNDETAAAEAAEEAMRNRAEQGYVTPMPPLELAADLKKIRDAIQHDLVAHAGRRPMVTDPSKTLPDTFHIGMSFEESLDFQSRMQARISEPQIKAEALALGVEESEIRSALMTRHLRQLNFLKDNRDHIVELYKGLSAETLDMDSAEDLFGDLPAITRMRLAAAADRGLFNARAREIMRHMTGQPDAAGNLAILDDCRRKIKDDVAAWLKIPSFEREVSEAVSRGAQLPQWSPAPHVQAKDNKDLALEKHAA
jgi:hypothetical protein